MSETMFALVFAKNTRNFKNNHHKKTININLELQILCGIRNMNAFNTSEAHECSALLINGMQLK